MKITELIPPEKLFELSHPFNLPKDIEERRESIKQYIPAIARCIKHCGSFPGIDVNSEINLTLGIILALDIALSQIPKQ